MSAAMLEQPTDFTSFELAEWIEIYLVLNGLQSISRAAVTTLFPSGQAPDGAELDQLFAEVRRRAEVAPRVYPFREVEESIVRSSEVDGRVYDFLLVLSIEAAPYRKQSRYNEINPSFELVTREALIAQVGGHGEGRRFGWPNGDGRPEKLGEAVEWLAKEMGLKASVVWDDVDDDDKDGGIDVAVWRPFADKSPSFTVWLAQCTVQATYERKTSDVKPAQWMTWIKFGQPPVTVLSVPYAIPSDAKVRGQMKYSVGLLLDRLRLCELLGDERTLSGFDEFSFLAEWVSAEVEATKLALSDGGDRPPRMAKRRRPKKEAAA
ncbi:hypothetical protein ACFC1I_14920 [Microbacterium sp. NPDC056044]|uniref:hypothetical protein n=1 Tax=Microbacterium sp. NPDC056044 TaxID=3345690 RepID=UPI0035DAA56B